MFRMFQICSDLYLLELPKTVEKNRAKIQNLSKLSITYFKQPYDSASDLTLITNDFAKHEGLAQL